MTKHDAAIMHFRQWWIRAVRSGYAYAEVVLLHRHSKYAIWRRLIISAVFWGVLLPIAIVLGTLVYPIMLAGILMYPLQVCRMALTKNPATLEAWISSFFILIAQFATVRGFLKYGRYRLRRQSSKLIEYK